LKHANAQSAAQHNADIEELPPRCLLAGVAGAENYLAIHDRCGSRAALIRRSLSRRRLGVSGLIALGRGNLIGKGLPASISTLLSQTCRQAISSVRSAIPISWGRMAHLRVRLSTWWTTQRFPADASAWPFPYRIRFTKSGGHRGDDGSPG